MMNTDRKLSKKTCIPCRGDLPPLKGIELKKLFNQLSNDWAMVDEHHIEKDYFFTDFKQALEFTDTVGKLAESERHHPDIHLSYGKVKIQLWTHKIDGLSESDFILAAKCDEILLNRNTF